MQTLTPAKAAGTLPAVAPYMGKVGGITVTTPAPLHDLNEFNREFSIHQLEAARDFFQAQLDACNKRITLLKGTPEELCPEATPPAAARMGSITDLSTMAAAVVVLRGMNKPMRIVDLAQAMINGGFKFRNGRGMTPTMKHMSLVLGSLLSQEVKKSRHPRVRRTELGVYAAS